MIRTPFRGSIALVLGALVAAVVAATAQAGSTIGILDVTKQVVKIQAQVDALTRAGQTAKTGRLMTRAVCGTETLAPVFAPWNDASHYVLAPAGSFETTTGWIWDPSSRIIADNNTFSNGSQALFLGGKGMAASPSMCVTTRHPTIRFFARNTGAPDAVLHVGVLYEGIDGKIKHLKVATLTAGNTWAPTISIPYRVNLIAAASPGGVTAVSFVFQTSGGKGKANVVRKLQHSGHKGQGDKPAVDRGDDPDGGRGDAGSNQKGYDDDDKGSQSSPAANPSETSTDRGPTAPKPSAGTDNRAKVGGWVIDDLYVDPFKIT